MTQPFDPMLDKMDRLDRSGRSDVGTFEQELGCERSFAKYHGDDRYIQISCTCGECLNEEDAYDWLDYLAQLHHTPEDQRNWYALVALYGYELPHRIWKHVVSQMSEWQQHDAEMAERAAGWDSNP